MTYRHTQIGSVIIAAIALAIILLLMSFGMKGPIQTIPVAVVLILGLALVVFHSQPVEIKDSRLECRLGPGIIKKTFALAEINDARKVRIPWYSGWGIRWIPGQYLLWRVSGFQAVELVLNDGSRFRIGTNEPDTLIRAIYLHKTE